MKRAYIRSTLFNIAFIIATSILCIAYIPLLLLPRSWFLNAVRFWIHVTTFLEYTILGLSYEVRGREHLPAEGSYLIAAKHQSQYETFKLQILFKDPAIILKKELLSIPLWGAYLKKSGVIAIDRSTPEKALKSIEDGAVLMKNAGRPVVIFPQGTRVRPDETTGHKPYKAGIARVQEATDLPIIPMALNSGIFWPRGGWFKTPGKVIFEFMAPIQPGQDRKTLMRELEDKIESGSHSLMNEARAKELQDSPNVKSYIGLAVVAVLLIAVYTSAWFKVAEQVEKSYVKILTDIAGAENARAPAISGFPGPIRLDVAEQVIQSDTGFLKIEKLQARGWPIPFIPIKIETGPVTVSSFRWPTPIVLDNTEASITFIRDVITIRESEVHLDNFTGGATGTIDLKQEPVPKFELMVSLENHSTLLLNLAQREIIDTRAALFMGAGFSALADNDGIVHVPLTQRDQTLYAGPLPVASLPVLRHQAPGNQPAPAQ